MNTSGNYRRRFYRLPLGTEPDVDYQVRSPVLGFVRGNLTFDDGSTLHVREFVDVEHGVTRLTYAYQYMAAHRPLADISL